jgi:hypothetical protein
MKDLLEFKQRNNLSGVLLLVSGILLLANVVYEIVKMLK